MFPTDGFQKLLERAGDGDREATDRLLSMLRPELERLAGGYANSARAAESTQDIVQEAWVRAWQNFEQFRGTKGGDEEARKVFSAWVGQIVHRVGLNAQRAWRSKSRSPENKSVVRIREASESGVDPPHGDPTPSAIVGTGEEERRVREAIDGIPDETDRRIIVARFFEGLSLREVARRLDLPYKRVRSRFQAALDILERELGGTI